ncbi:MAG TPA: PilT/PilU family type 4a pilus ATPase [Sedimentisphaerales bacterium]|nr:PilT/PilU family type 4a pilus ATPase [Sedimentisphaerales bacterium]
MSQTYDPHEKVYPTENLGKLSIIDMLKYFEEKGAMRVSDLHIKVGTAPAYRIDGELVKLKGVMVTTETAKLLIYPLLSEENTERLNKNYSVDCSYRTGSLQFRINVFKENDGICAAIRALSMEIPHLEAVGFPNNVWENIIELKQGLVLLTGITGAGKSTTISSMINAISKKRACRILTIEDPIEYLFPQRNAMISQREVGKDVHSFVDGLRALLREDPDVIFVGEMRDPETISMTLMAAETGHLVFSTLHTRDTVGSISRILDYYPPERQAEVRSQLSLGLAYVISQKLVPRKDHQGRLIAMEILNNNYACANLIRTGKLEQIYSQLQTKTKDRPDENMITFENHLARLVQTGQLELLEAQKWANKITVFQDAMKCNLNHNV